MKSYFLFALVSAAILTTACNKDEETSINPNPSNSGNGTPSTEIDTNYMVGQYKPERQLTLLTENGESQTFTWETTEPYRLVSAGPDGSLRTFDYDAHDRQSVVHIPASSTMGAQTLSFEYSGDHLAQFNLSGNTGNTLIQAATTYDGNRIQTAYYSEIDESVIGGFIDDFLNTQRKDLVDYFAISNLQTEYSWVGSNVTQEHITADGVVDIQVGELVELLHLDTSVYRLILDNAGLDPQIASFITPELIATFVDMMADSNCHIIIDVDLNLLYSYDGHPNPLYGFWGWGFLGNTRVLSKNNILAVNREGLTTAYISINLPTEVPNNYDFATTLKLTLILNYLNSQYPDGFRYNYPIDLEGEEHNTYTYDKLGWPTSCVNTNGESQSTTTFSYDR